MGLKHRMSAAYKALFAPGRISESGDFWILSGGTSLATGQFAPEQVLLSSVAGPAVNWIAASIIDARLQVTDDEGRPAPAGPLAALLDNPNPDLWSQSAMVQSLTTALVSGGTAYLHINRDERIGGIPAKLEYVDPGSVGENRYSVTRPDGSARQVILDPLSENTLIRFRFGVRPSEPRLGISPLACCLSEMTVDADAALMARALMRNMGMPGAIMMPTAEDRADPPTPEALARMKRQWRKFASSSNSGSLYAMQRRMDVTPFQVNLRGMNPVEFRNMAEERVSAAVRVPAPVLGFGAGLQATKVGATQEQLTRSAWRTGVLPWMRIIADGFNQHLLPEFPEGLRPGYSIGWDTTGVPELQDDLSRKLDQATRMADLGIPMNQVIAALDLPVEPLPAEIGDRAFLPAGRFEPSDIAVTED